VGEGLGEVAQRLAAQPGLLGVEAFVVQLACREPSSPV
jgi:hypothetical protein